MCHFFEMKSVLSLVENGCHRFWVRKNQNSEIKRGWVMRETILKKMG
ncbi:hypothetical protein DFO70_13810 [Cytobacillus firmus]|uniref:Uncharacterized protein n=2 Tax=Cytobacillus TaxID=2675230 RepID=A0A366JG28_CYTFI|nr:hypothetical protein DFO70_13810 [Cytobacillus firmus]TDX35099.1 hypothetical protein DFO72_1311 [Cytobacillus oceanisediminis]